MTGGARHLHPSVRWMDGEMEEERDDDKLRQRGKGSVTEMVEEGKITQMHDYAFF